MQTVNLTQIPIQVDPNVGDSDEMASPAFEFSAREVSPPALLIQQLLRAHQVFLLHYAPSLSELWIKVPRPKFCNFLKRFWDGFIWTWDVLLHGNPALDVYNGLKLSAGGELGIGQSEEESGSGEREVLEGFVKRTKGLVDMVVSRFEGIPVPSGRQNALGTGHRFGFSEYPNPSDGVIFSGVGALTRTTVRDVSSWIEWLSIYGESAFGVRENPTAATRRRKKVRREKAETQVGEPSSGPKIPASIVSRPEIRVHRQASSQQGDKVSVTDARSEGEASIIGTETFVKYLTLGVYGSSWGIPAGRPEMKHRPEDSSADDNPKAQQSNVTKIIDEPLPGHFLIGLLGDLESDEATDEASAGEDGIEVDADQDGLSTSKSYDRRILVRTLQVERRRQRALDAAFLDDNKDIDEYNDDGAYFDRLRVVVYVQPPFIFTLLFESRADSLIMSSFYRSLHHQLGPLQKPLQARTSPEAVRKRLERIIQPRSTAAKSTQTISDLVYDPTRLTIHTSIPNIPELATISTEENSQNTWTRAEAITVHGQILNTYAVTRRSQWELERTCKTSRGWWVVWMRLPPQLLDTPSTLQDPGMDDREAFLIRKASDYVGPEARKTPPGGRFRAFGGGSSSKAGADGGGWGGGASKLAEGIGIDARQYVESLLSLTR